MLLGLVAQGISHPSDRMIHLHGMQISPSVTVGAIAADQYTYASLLCIEDDHLVLHMGKLSMGCILTISCAAPDIYH